MNSTILEVVLGAIISIVITVFIEWLRKPKLIFYIGKPSDRSYETSPAKEARFLGIELSNEPLPEIFRWLQRNTAMQCHGTIEFYHLDGQNVFGRPMPIRWSSSIEPVPMAISVGNQDVKIFDPQSFTVESRVDVFPGEKERLDVAVKFDNDSECYGWNNESYSSDPVWRNKRWKLQNQRYFVKITIVSSGEKVTKIFRLINDVSRQDFRIEPALKSDKVG